MTALEQAIAEIEAEGRAAAAHRAKVNADSRIIYLRKVCEELSHRHVIVSHGYAGFAQMMAYQVSSMSARHSRAGALLRARLGQLGGFRKQASHNLECAARARVEETFRRAKEQIDTSMSAVDRALEGLGFRHA